jgi:hypothetical protein
VPDPAPDRRPVAAFVAGLAPDGRLVRFPATAHPPELAFRHVVAHADHAELRELDGAAVVCADEPDRLEELLGAWPAARLAAVAEPGRCTVRLRDGRGYVLSADTPDPLRLASFAYLRLAAHADIVGEHRLDAVVITSVPVH